MDKPVVKILKCVDNDILTENLTIGQFYECVKEDKDFYYIVDDACNTAPYCKYRFELEMEVNVNEEYLDKYHSEKKYNEFGKRIISLTI